jgi:hypothetical protein
VSLHTGSSQPTHFLQTMPVRLWGLIMVPSVWEQLRHGLHYAHNPRGIAHLRSCTLVCEGTFTSRPNACAVLDKGTLGALRSPTRYEPKRDTASLGGLAAPARLKYPGGRPHLWFNRSSTRRCRRCQRSSRPAELLEVLGSSTQVNGSRRW